MSQHCYRLDVARLFNEKHTHPLLYTGMAERTFFLEIQWLEPVITLNCSIICIGKQGKLYSLNFIFHVIPTNWNLAISFSGILCPSDFLMIEIIYDHRMSLRDSAIRHFIIHKGTIILLSHFLSFYFKCFKIAAVMLI